MITRNHLPPKQEVIWYQGHYIHTVKIKRKGLVESSISDRRIHMRIEKNLAFNLACLLATQPVIQIPPTSEDRTEQKRYLHLHTELLKTDLPEETKQTFLEFVGVSEDIAAQEQQDSFIAGFMTCYEMLCRQRI